jgi:hypothetical protein
MDNSFPQQGSDTQHRSGLIAGLQIFMIPLKWLAGLIELARFTEEEENDAGIYLGHQ